MNGTNLAIVYPANKIGEGEKLQTAFTILWVPLPN